MVSPLCPVKSLKRIAIHKLATIPGGILRIPVEKCPMVFQYVKDVSLTRIYYTKILSNMSLREVERICGVQAFMHILARILDMKEASLKLQVYFCSYASEKLVVADHLYMFGLGDLVVQGYMKQSPRMQYFRLLSSSTPTSLPDPFAILPRLRYAPECVQSVGFHLVGIPEGEYNIPLVEVGPATLYKFLTNLLLCRMNQRWFEAWVFGLAALDAVRVGREKQDELFIIILELSLCSVNIGMPDKMTSGILAVAEDMRFSGPTRSFHWALCKSRTYVAAGKFKQEMFIFQKFFPRLRRRCLLRNQFLESHILGLLELAENHLIWSFLNSYMRVEESLNRSRGMGLCRDIEDNLDLMESPQKTLERYLRGRLHMMRACFEEDSCRRNELLSSARTEFEEVACSLDTGLMVVECEVLAEYLTRPYRYPTSKLDRFQKVTRSYYSRVQAETMVRIFLTNSFAIKKIKDGSIPLYTLYEHYASATLNGGYRLPLLRLLRYTAEEDQRIPTLLTELPNRKTMYKVNDECDDSEATTICEEDEVPTSKELVHYCFISEQAWCIGSTRCQNSVRQN